MQDHNSIQQLREAWIGCWLTFARMAETKKKQKNKKKKQKQKQKTVECRTKQKLQKGVFLGMSLLSLVFY